MLYNARNKVAKLFYDYGDGIKILTAKKIFERITIALAQAKADNTSENLLNETVKDSLCIEYILCIEQMKSLKKYVTI